MPAGKPNLDDHVRFELDRWTGDQLATSLRGEVAALYAWLGSVRVDEITDPDATERAVIDIVSNSELDERVLQSVVDSVLAAHREAEGDSTPLSQLVSRETYDSAAATLMGLEELRAEITLQVTTSEVYSQLMSHVLYQGIKNYLQTENVIAKKVPGAATLMRLGQNAVNSAAPKLEKSIDRQLTAFVNSNISDTIRDSRNYLDRVLDEAVLGAVSDEMWQTNAESTVADVAGLIPADALEELVRAAWDAWIRLRGAPVTTQILHVAIRQFYVSHGARPVTELLTDAGLDEDRSVEIAIAYLTPALSQAAEDGFLESRIRARLAPYYESLNT